MIEPIKPIEMKTIQTGTGPVRLTQTVSGAGWASKLAPGDLDKALCGLKLPQDDNVLVGLEGADDAGVYRISEDLAIIQKSSFRLKAMVEEIVDLSTLLTGEISFDKDPVDLNLLAKEVVEESWN